MKWLALVPDWLIVAVVLALLAALFAVSTTAYVRVAAAQVQAADAKQELAQERAAHATQLAAATARVSQAATELQAKNAEQELRDADAKKTIDQLRADLRGRARAAGGPGLRDPYAAACPSPEPAAAAAAGDRGADPAPAGRTLSAELEGFLVGLAEDADRINAAYGSCRAFALNLRAKLQELRLAPVAHP